MFKYTYIHIYMYIYTYIHVLEILSLCAASWMWVRHRSVVIVPPEGGLEFSAGLTKTILFLFMSRLTNSLGIPLQDCNRVTNHTRFLLLTRSTSVEDCCSRIERGARKIAECTSYTPCVLLSFSPPPLFPTPRATTRSNGGRHIRLRTSFWLLLSSTSCCFLGFRRLENATSWYLGRNTSGPF